MTEHLTYSVRVQWPWWNRPLLGVVAWLVRWLPACVALRLVLIFLDRYPTFVTHHATFT